MPACWSSGAPPSRINSELAPGERCAPPLTRSEARSALHESSGGAGWGPTKPPGRARLGDADVELRKHPGLADEAWRIADELGWAKTYDAEYVALASLLGCRP